MDGGAGLTEKRAGVPDALMGDILGKGGLDDVVAVPTDAVDAETYYLFTRETTIQLRGMSAGLGLAGELVA